MSSLDIFDSSRPRSGAVISSKEFRDIIKAAATFNAGSLEPRGDAVLIGDVRIKTVSLVSKYSLDITINDVNQVVNAKSQAVNPAATTPGEIVAAINAAFGETVAYLYDTEGFSGSSFIALVAPRSVASPSIIINENEDGTDAQRLVFNLNDRGSGMPYIVNTSSVPYGLTWLKTTNNIDDSIQIYLGSPAIAVGKVNLGAGSGTIDLSFKNKMRILIKEPTATWPASGNPLDITIAGSTPAATTPSEIVSAINSAFTSLPGWSGQGPAALVTKDGVGQYLAIYSGPANNPSKGTGCEVQISGVSIIVPSTATPEFQFLIDDAMPIVMGYAVGDSEKKFDLLPLVFTGSRFSNSFIRGISNRTGAGIGPWGPALDTSTNIPTTGSVDGEVRFARDTGVPWIYRAGNFITGSVFGGWRRAIPGYQYPLSYSKALESYKLNLATDTYVAEPKNILGYSSIALAPVIDTNHEQSGKIGTVVSLVDGRDSKWKNTVYTDNKKLWNSLCLYDQFRKAGVDCLTRTWNGVPWDTNPSYGRFYGYSSSQLEPGYIGPYPNFSNGTVLSGQENWSSVYATGDIGYITNAVATSGNTVWTFRLPANIKPGKVYFWVYQNSTIDQSLTNFNRTTTTAPYYRFYGTTDVAVPGSLYRVKQEPTNAQVGTINYGTGEVSITMPAGVDPAAYGIAYTANYSDTVSVAVEVRKSPDAEQKVGYESCWAGVLYNDQIIGGGAPASYGFLVRVSDQGRGQLISRAGGGGADITVGEFVIDPPLDTTWRTLRVLYQVIGNTAFHSIFWNGSYKSDEWIDKDITAATGGSLTASQTAGGVEQDRQTSKLVALITQDVTALSGYHLTNISGHLAGIYLKPTHAITGFGVKEPQLKNFQCHSGKSLISFLNPYPALPPVSGVRLRDVIGAVQLQKNGVEESNVITDCSAENPMAINLQGDLASGNTTGIEPYSRKLNIGLSVPLVLSRKDLRFLYRNTTIGPVSNAPLNTQQNYCSRGNLANQNGNYAIWSLNELVEAGIVGGNYTGLDYGDDFIVANNLIGASNGPSKYWNPYTQVYTQSTGVSFQSPYTTPRILSNTFVTTLPKPNNNVAPYNTANWVYNILCAEIRPFVNPALQYAAGGYYMPYFTKIEIVPSSDPNNPYAIVNTDIQYVGQAIPYAIRLTIMANRVGTEY